MSQTTDRPSMPKSMRHKRILDVAADQPEASLDDIASKIPSATVEYVEGVLDQYGDPADEHTGKGSSADESAAEIDSADDQGEGSEPGDDRDADEDAAADRYDDRERAADHDAAPTDAGEPAAVTEAELPELDALPEKQRTVLRTIAEHPEATQQEVADLVGVSAPTISNRVNEIDGFDWQHRQELIATIMQTDTPTSPEETTPMESTTTTHDQQSPDEQFNERLTALEEQMASLPRSSDQTAVLGNPELAHKVIHACMQSDAISEEEELELLRALLE